MSYHVHISPKTEGFTLNLKEVWQYRDLILLLTKKTFSLTYKQTVLGPAWIILNPLLSSLAYLFVFGVVAGISTGGVPHILFYLTSTAFWGLFSYVLTNNARTFIDNANIFGKVYFPRLTVSISYVLVGLIMLAIQMILVVILMAIFMITGDIHPNPIMWLTVPLGLLQLCVLGMSIGIILSSLTTKYRDLQVLVSFGMTLWMFATPVVYPASEVSNGVLHTLVMLNPASAPIEWLRYALFGTGSAEPLYLLISVLVTVLCAVVGIGLFNHVEKTFIDTV